MTPDEFAVISIFSIFGSSIEVVTVEFQPCPKAKTEKRIKNTNNFFILLTLLF
jgi:hypothetical protein